MIRSQWWLLSFRSLYIHRITFNLKRPDGNVVKGRVVCLPIILGRVTSEIASLAWSTGGWRQTQKPSQTKTLKSLKGVSGQYKISLKLDSYHDSFDLNTVRVVAILNSTSKYTRWWFQHSCLVFRSNGWGGGSIWSVQIFFKHVEKYLLSTTSRWWQRRYIVYCYSYFWKWSIFFRAYFSNGLKPPIRHGCFRK